MTDLVFAFPSRMGGAIALLVGRDRPAPIASHAAFNTRCFSSRCDGGISVAMFSWVKLACGSNLAGREPQAPFPRERTFKDIRFSFLHAE